MSIECSVSSSKVTCSATAACCSLDRLTKGLAPAALGAVACDALHGCCAAAWPGL
jgi:hypothetical protein